MPVSMIEENLGRVIDSVVRNVSAGRGAVPDLDVTDSPMSPEHTSEAADTLADLYGHVAHALKSMDSPPHALASYRAPEQPASPPTLNLVR
jgi:hypothetical protein